MESVKGANGFVGKRQAGALDDIGADSENVPVVRRLDKATSAALCLFLGNLVQRTSADDDTLAFDKSKVRGENELCAAQMVSRSRAAALSKKP